MVFVLFCHQLDNIHVKGNFILFALKVCEFFVGKRRNITLIGSWFLTFQQTSQYYFDWTPVFDVSAKIKKNFFWFFGQVQSRSDGVCSSFATHLTMIM